MSRRVERWGAAVAIVVASVSTLAIACAIAVAATGPLGWRFAVSTLGVAGAVFAWVGAVVAVSRPGNRIAWLLIGVGLLGTSGALAEQLSIGAVGHGRALPIPVAAAWYAEWYWLPWNYLQFVFLPLLFPTGRLPSSRWRWLAAVATVGLTTKAFIAMFAQHLHIDAALEGVQTAALITIENPVGWLPIDNLETGSLLGLLFVMMGSSVAAVSSLVVRYRSSTRAERQQLAWAVYGVCVTVAGLLSASLYDVVTDTNLAVVEVGLLFVVPVTLAIAIMRHSLFDIERVISRTVGYAVVTLVLAGVYAAGVLGVGALVPGESSDLLVAASTLVVAALFQPVRRRVQSVVDRRFNRARYDAQQEVSVLADRLRQAVELERLVDELAVTVDRVVRPASVSLVLLDDGGRP